VKTINTAPQVRNAIVNIKNGIFSINRKGPMPAEPEQLPPKVTNAPPFDVFHNPLMCPITARDLEFRSPTGITLPPRNVLFSSNH